MKQKIRRIWFPVLISLLLITSFVLVTYRILDRAVTQVIVAQIDEISNHDMRTIQNYINRRWEMLERLKMELLIRDPKDQNELKEELSIGAASNDCVALYLIDDDGNLYSDTGTVLNKTENQFLHYFNNNKTQFVYRYDESDLPSARECMLYGISWEEEPVQIAGKKFVGILLLNDISKIRENIRITCFGESGYTTMIDADGTFIVNDFNASGLNRFNNFYDFIADRPIRGTTMEQITQKMQDHENIQFWYTNREGNLRFVSVIRIENSDWCFVTTVDHDAFSEQMTGFTRLAILIFTELIFLLLFVFILISLVQARRKRLYTSVANGVYNRLYYNDKLEKAKLTALALVDLDHLKAINDNYGHMTGDQAIRKVAEVIFRNAGKDSVVCRYGGDELIVAWKGNIEEKVFLDILDDLSRKVHEITFEEFPNLRLTFSVGGYYAKGTGSALLERADELLYLAKQDRDCVVTANRETMP